MSGIPEDIQHLDDQYIANERDARTILAALDERVGGWRQEPGSWSVAECFDHLAVSNRVYLQAMAAPAREAREHGRLRRGPARPGPIGGLFARCLEPPVNPRFKSRAPKTIVPRQAPSLADAAGAFLGSHDAVRAFLRDHADLDLAGVRFPNPFVRGVRFSLATGFHVLAAHERRHLWQARRVREAAERALVAQQTDPS